MVNSGGGRIDKGGGNRLPTSYTTDPTKPTRFGARSQESTSDMPDMMEMKDMEVAALTYKLQDQTHHLETAQHRIVKLEKQVQFRV